MNQGDSEWSKKGATLSDASARKEFGLTQEEIVAAINDGRLQYRVQNMYGNPYFRLLRSEVEALIEATQGEQYLATKKFKKELAEINKQMKQLKAQMESLEKRKRELLGVLGE